MFNNKEKARIGTIYHTVGPEPARKAGLEIVTPKLPQLVRRIEEAAGGKQAVLYCWRGGLRSHSLAIILDLMNIHIYRLNGGYKKYRQWINNYFHQEELPCRLITLHGLTGTGKTKVISTLISLGAGAVDLQGMAHNRGSVFGYIGLPAQPSQKLFESLLWNRLYLNQGKKHLVVEGESRRIGKITLPALFFRAMETGKRILLWDEIESRVNRIISEYRVVAYERELIEALSRLKDRLGAEHVLTLSEMIKEGNYYPAVEKLLTNYYDPLYCHLDRTAPEYDLVVNSTDETQAAEKILTYLSTLETR